MKKLILFALALVLIFPNNGCRILKHKKLEKRSEEVKVQNDVKVKMSIVDSLASVNKGVYEKSNSTIKETISYKTPVSEPVELTAKFKVDTSKSLKGDTALTLVDVNNKDVSITIVHNKKTNELTAKVKTGGRTKDIPFNEMLINRTITNGKDSGDTTKINVDVKKKNLDSADRSKKETTIKNSSLEKRKDNKPDFWVWVGVVAVICFFLWLGFKK